VIILIDLKSVIIVNIFTYLDTKFLDMVLHHVSNFKNVIFI